LALARHSAVSSVDWSSLTSANSLRQGMGLPYPRRNNSKSVEFLPLTSAFWLWLFDCMDTNREPAELKKEKVT
jgi:hypothetical protein